MDHILLNNKLFNIYLKNKVFYFLTLFIKNTNLHSFISK
ncbi:hypothetical protein AcetOrient_orf00996 [Acetobacter orientalis]|uniref:Uncharacterized protein n=1 Tax=Acetobacter orientalis TaxID=146474 RepID=A0A2Z5ZER2_9PROT|nr:hypothetical protein AcetOrient_orf00996 [Acetobacter orientalis]